MPIWSYVGNMAIAKVGTHNRRRRCPTRRSVPRSGYPRRKTPGEDQSSGLPVIVFKGTADPPAGRSLPRCPHGLTRLMGTSFFGRHVFHQSSSGQVIWPTGWSPPLGRAPARGGACSHRIFGAAGVASAFHKTPQAAPLSTLGGRDPGSRDQKRSTFASSLERDQPQIPRQAGIYPKGPATLRFV
jgi:hypothetical protein